MTPDRRHTGFMFLFSALALLLAFLTIEVTTAHGFIVPMDVWFENLLFSVRTPFLLSVFNWITLLGNPFVVIGIAGFISILILLSKRGLLYVTGLAVTLLGAVASDYLMKILIGRARPGGLIPSTIETSFSFPSGHATAGIALYGFIAFLLCKLYPKNAGVTTAMAAAIILAVGFSRLYLGVHFPSDIIAGYALGGLWLLIGIQIVRRFQTAEN
ncbi:MAG: phosphatase PAP2 family protein [Minisyncoccota bacterium]